MVASRRDKIQLFGSREFSMELNGKRFAEEEKGERRNVSDKEIRRD